MIFECVGVPGLIQQCIDLAGIRGRVVVAGACFQDDAIKPVWRSFGLGSSNPRRAQSSLTEEWKLESIPSRSWNSTMPDQ